jgi:hypothetical protein
MFKGHDPKRGEFVNNPAYWCGGSRNLNELIDVEFRHAENHLEPPDWTGDDIYWGAMNGKPFFRKGRRSPMYNTSQGMAKLMHPGYYYNFPGPNTSIDELPGYRTTKPIECSTFKPFPYGGVEKPLISGFMPLEMLKEGYNDDAKTSSSLASSARWRGSRKDRGIERSGSAPTLRGDEADDAGSLFGSEFSFATTRVSERAKSVASERSLGVSELGSVARSKLGVRPYHFGALPGGKWPQHGGRLVMQRAHVTGPNVLSTGRAFDPGDGGTRMSRGEMPHVEVQKRLTGQCYDFDTDRGINQLNRMNST